MVLDYFFSSFLAQSIQKLPTSKTYNNFWQFLHRRSVLVLSQPYDINQSEF